MGSVDIPFAAHSHRDARRAFSRDDGRSKNSTTALLYDEEGDAGARETRRKGNRNLPLQIRVLVIRKKFVSAYSLTYQCYRLRGS